MVPALRRFFDRLASFAFYAGLDVVVGAIAYAISFGEADLTRGQLMIRMMTAIMLANGIVGGPDIMLFWRESGRRISAEERLEVATQERDEAQARLAERDRKIDELHARIQRLEAEQPSRQRQRRSRRRRLRNNGQ